MSTPLSQRVLAHARMATAVAIAGAVVALPTVASARNSQPAADVNTPWTSPSDVLAESLHRMQAAAVTEVTPAPAPQPAPEPETPAVFATVDDEVELIEPTLELSEIGFHEGSSASLEIDPVGTATVNESWIETPDVADGPEYAIMASRGRGVAPTTAVDLAMPEDTDVASIVTGTIVSVNRYSLYGEVPDVFIEIQPEGHPDLKVQMFHIRDITVAVGDEVVAGQTTVAGSPRTLPFPSQIDRLVGHPGPHVHVQVVRA